MRKIKLFSVIVPCHNEQEVLPATHERLSKILKEGLSEAFSVDNELLWKKDGTSFPVEYWLHPIKADGKVVGCVVTFVDITKRKSRGAVIGKYRMVIGLLEGIAMIVGGVVVQRFGLELIFYVTSAVFVLSTIPLFFIKE